LVLRKFLAEKENFDRFLISTTGWSRNLDPNGNPIRLPLVTISDTAPPFCSFWKRSCCYIYEVET